MSDRRLFEYALRLGDDALTLGHRLSEWCSNGPFLEEDIALTNIALDHIGRARMLLGYAAQVEGAGRNEDQLAYLRDCREYRNLLICELPRGDYGDTIARQFLIDAFNVPFFAALARSSDRTLGGIAGKAVKESRYHLRHSSGWVVRLGDGTEESHARLVAAFERVWGYSHELFEMDEIETSLAAEGIGVDREALRAPWNQSVDHVLAEAGIERPADDWRVDGGRRGDHTEHLGYLLAELQFVQRAYPSLQW